MARRRRNPRGSSAKLLTTLALVGGGAWLVLKLLDKFTGFNKDTPYEGHGAIGTAANIANMASGGALATVGAWAGRQLYDWTNPNTTGSMLFYRIALPSGGFASVGSDQIKGGVFTHNGQRYRVKVDGAGNKFAVPA